MTDRKGAKSAQHKSSSQGFLGSMLTGIAPRSTQTAKIHRMFRDGHAEEADFRAAIGRDSAQLLEAQKGFAFRSAGQSDWLDIMRPFASRVQGFARRASAGDDSVGPVTRWFRTNTFYRKPLVNGRISCSGDEIAGALPGGESSVAFMLAPYSFSRLVENSFYGSQEQLAIDYAKALSASSEALLRNGYACMLLLDPCVGFEQSLGTFTEPGWYRRSVTEAKGNGVRLGINFPLAEARDVIPIAEGTGADFIGIDAVFTSDFRVSTKKDVLLGVVDGARAGVESEETIGRKVKEFVDSADFSGRYYIGPNDRLYDVPFDIALRKIGMLSGFRGVG